MDLGIFVPRDAIAEREMPADPGWNVRLLQNLLPVFRRKCLNIDKKMTSSPVCGNR
jgi:hypothetical protein